MIYVDTPKWYDTPLRYKVWSHMWSDECDQELHEMADKIGLRREWFQSAQPNATDKWKRYYNHYDVTPRLRQAAIRHGALQMELLDYLEYFKGVQIIRWSQAENYHDADERDMLDDPAHWANVGPD